MKVKKKIRGFAVIMGLSLFCSACGKKEPEKITSYGMSGSTTNDAVSEEAEGDTSSKKEGDTSSGKEMGPLPERQLGGNPVWESSFMVDTVPVEISINQVIRDTDTLHVFKMVNISEDLVREAETVKNIFGDTAKEVKRPISGAGGDALRLVWDAGQFILSHEGSSQFNFSEESETDSWKDSNGFFWHTYEGKYMNTDYQLGIGYDGEEKFISLYPKNPGELIGVPACDHIEEVWFSDDLANSYYWNGVYLNKVMEGRPNRTQSTEDSLCEATLQFAKDVLGFNMSRDDLRCVTGQELGSPRTNEIFYYSKEDEENPELPNAVREGYVFSWDMFHAGDLGGLWGNAGRIGVTDKGVVGGTFLIDYEVMEELTGNAEVLKFDAVMESLSDVIRKNLDVKKINGQKLKISQAMLIYYPVTNEENPRESTLVPAWDFKMESNGQIGEIVLNAVDGSMLTILYMN